MAFRPPDRPRDWVLLFSPAALMLVATLVGGAFEKRGKEEAILLWSLMASFLAAPLCIALGFVFTKPNPRWPVRAGWVLLAALAVAVVNYSIAIGGCVLALR